MKDLQMTFEEFKSKYKNSPYRAKWYWGLIPGRKAYSPVSFEPVRRWLPDIRQVLFGLRFLVPDKNGFFGRDKGTWCWPWQWYRKYYNARYGT